MPLVDFEARAIATLQERVAAMAERNEDLVAFARGHAGAASAIHEAVLATLTADDPAALARIVTDLWPAMLGVDVAAIAWGDAGEGWRADGAGRLVPVEPRLLARMLREMPPVSVRAVGRGHPLFGAAGADVRGEALIRLDGDGLRGVVLLGQRAGEIAEGPHGARLLRFLGQATALMLDRCSRR